MIKFMLFIDGTWLYSNTSRLVEASGEPGFVLDFGKLPRVLAEEVGRRLGHDEWTVVRTHLFGSFAANVDLRDREPVERRLNFFTMLRQQHHYEIEAFPIEFRGKRLRRTDRDPGDSFEPKEKCVDIALATSMLFNAAMTNAYDVAIAVLGDQDFKPVLQSVRRLGSRYDPHVLECQSPAHKGDRHVETTYYPKRGEKFYCPACREEFARQREAAASGGLAGAPAIGGNGGDVAVSEPVTYAPTDTTLAGVVKHKRVDKSYG